jgi:hypothetical protein
MDDTVSITFWVTGCLRRRQPVHGYTPFRDSGKKNHAKYRPENRLSGG